MNKSDLKLKLQFVSTKKVGLELYFLYRNSDNVIQLLRADFEKVQEALTHLEYVFVNKIRNQILNQDAEGKKFEDDPDWSLKHIKDVDNTKNTLYYFPNKVSDNDDYHIPDEFLEMVKLKDKTFESVEPYEFEKHTMESVLSFLIRLQIDNEQVILFKQKYSIDSLSRASIFRILGSVKEHKTRFSLEKNSLLKLTDKIDFIFIADYFIILNLNLLESKYGFNERYLKNGAESLRFIKSKNILVNTDKFDELVKKVSFSKKLMKVKEDNEVLKTPIAEIKKFIDDYKSKDKKFGLDKRITFIPIKNKFEVKSKAAAENFLKLLNDLYLISLLTGKPYIAESPTEFKENQDEEVS